MTPECDNLNAFEPKIVAFLCSWCSYAGADRAGSGQIPCPPNVRIVRVMCSGRVDASLVLEAYRKGADGVVILACHLGDCHYRDGNMAALKRHRLLLRMLSVFGISEERCRFDYVSANEGERFADIISRMVHTLRLMKRLSVV
ncbi:MAG TPA: hydrogenase iron-sulfur subunit [Dissulfurispiraceae bacterium]|nr:hydrogenase iron-sulfur subunit [Dissulfurispiraceae bacterium]